MMLLMVARSLTSSIMPLLVQLPDSIFVTGIALFFLLVAVIAIVMNYRLRMQLNKTQSALSESIKGRPDMISHFNREVLTPLNGVIGMSEQLTHSLPDKEQRELLDAIDNAAGMLEGIMTNARDVYDPAKSEVQFERKEVEDMTGSFMEGRYILVADDQEMNLLLLTRILSRWKCKFDKASDGIAAYDLFSKYEYDIVLLDVQMPGMTGLEVVKKIREDHDAMKAKIPVLAITSDITLRENSRYRDVGFTDCMLKPFRERDIYNMIIRHLPPAEIKVF